MSKSKSSKWETASDFEVPLSEECGKDSGRFGKLAVIFVTLRGSPRTLKATTPT